MDPEVAFHHTPKGSEEGVYIGSFTQESSGAGLHNPHRIYLPRKT
jgi:hypothetical protein